MGLALEEPQPDETIFELDGVKFAVTKWAKVYAEGATVDYIRGWGGAGFTVTAAPKWFERNDEDW